MVSGPTRPGSTTSAMEDWPTRHPREITIGVLQDQAGCGSNESVLLVFDALTHAVHRLGYLIGLVACDVFLERVAVHLASGLARTASEPFDVLKDLVRDRNRSLHTQSITNGLDQVNRSYCSREAHSKRPHNLYHVLPRPEPVTRLLAGSGQGRTRVELAFSKSAARSPSAQLS